MNRVPGVLGSTRELGTVVAVAALCGGYAAALIMASSMLGRTTGSGGILAGILLGVVSTVFIGIALYVAAVVITGCVATVIAGRLKQIALLRLLGADGRALRRSIGSGTAKVGFVGSLAGVVVGTVLADGVRVFLVARGTMPKGDYAWFSGQSVLAVVAITCCAAVAGWVGSRRILAVTPAQALAEVQMAQLITGRVSRLRAVVSVVLTVAGGAGLLLALRLGETASQAGFLMAFGGSVGSATGILIGARFIVPSIVDGFGRILGSDPASLIARRNAVADPMRTTRSTIGLIVGVTLITTFSSGASALRASVARTTNLSSDQQAQADQFLAIASAVMICVVVISCVISCIGFVSTMSLTVIQRRREIGLLRALGFTAGQVRSMITRESVALSASAVLFGVSLGVVYGSVGAQSLVGSFTPGFAWGLPWSVLVAIAVGGVALVVLASRPPARRAIAVSPVEALSGLD